MKIDNSGYIAKSALFIVCGVLVGFFPSIITWIFYVIGGLIVLVSLFTALTSIGSDDGGFGLFGVVIGVGVMFLPKLLFIGIGIIGGILFMVLGIIRLVKASNKSYPDHGRILNGILGGALVVASLLLFANPFGAAMKITGILMIIYGLFNAYIARIVSQRNASAEQSSSPDVIDVTNFTVHDDK